MDQYDEQISIEIKNDEPKLSIKENIEDQLLHRHERERELIYVDDNPLYKGDYQIAICQNGEFAVTFDTVNLRIKILKNTDHRSFKKKKKKKEEKTSSEPNNEEEITETVAYFELKDDLTIKNLIKLESTPGKNIDDGSNSNNITSKKFRWSLDISNIQRRNDDKYIYVSVSRINVDEDMKGQKDDKVKGNILTLEKHYTENKVEENNQKTQEAEEVKGTSIYCLKIKENEYNGYDLSNVTYYSSSISGICRFVEDLGPSDKQENFTEQETSILKRFIVLNIHGIYNYEVNDFNFKNKFDYPKSLKDELYYYHKENDCVDKLLSCLYDQYFLAEQYKNNMLALDVYDLEKMELKISAKKVERKDKHIRKYNKTAFSISKLQLCFTRGINSIKLYLMDNGLETAAKSFDGIDEICSLEFIDNDEKILIIGKGPRNQKENLVKHEEKLIPIDENQEKKLDVEEEPIPIGEVRLIIWDLYNSEEPIVLPDFLTIKNLESLARTSGNLLQVDGNGKVTSVLKKVDNELRRILNQNQTDQPRDLISYKQPYIKPSDEKHKLYFDISKNPNFKPITSDKEPWVMENYERHSYCLYQDKAGTLQLIVGRSTVQIWHQIHDESKKKDELPNKGEPFLEYIWTNGIPLDQEREETRLRIDEMKYGLDDFCLKVYWYERKIEVTEKVIESENEIINQMENEKNEKNETNKAEVKGNEIMKRKVKTIQWKHISEKVKAIKYACQALKHLNKRRNLLGNGYINIHKYEEMVNYIQHIIWRFVNLKPVQYRLLDIRYNTMKNLILGDCHHLIKFILFGDEGKEEKIRHIPTGISWSGKDFMKGDNYDYISREMLKGNDKLRPENNMELAIYHCKGRELKDTILVAYLLEYYSKHATEDAGWMCTVSRALPLLFKHNYDDYARKLFRKECFVDQDHFSAQDPYEILPESYLTRRNYNFNLLAFGPNVKLNSNNCGRYDRIWKLSNQMYELFESFKFQVYEFFKGIDKDLGRPPLALRIVPLPGFTKHRIKREIVEYNLKRIILNVLLFIFIPRWYRIRHYEKYKLSPFARVVLYGNNDDIYDNPATEAVIHYRWREARNYFSILFLRFLIFTLCFASVSWAYLEHKVISEGIRNLLIASIVIFYYLAIYLLITELIQLNYQGFREYLDIYNIFDVSSIMLPVIVMSIMLKDFQFSDGFGSVTDARLSVGGVSFSIFLLWIELILYLRLIPKLAIHVYRPMIIFKTVYPLFLVIIIVVIAFAHTLFILINYSNIPTKNSTLSGVATNTATNEKLDIQLQSDFNATDQNDNPFSTFFTAIEAAYFWMNGDWTLRNQFDFWAINVLTFMASFILVIILQNMLIAYMGGVFEKSESKTRQMITKYRANQVAEYEALYQIHLWPPEPEPKYIYYICHYKYFEEWLENVKDGQGPIYKDFVENTITKYTFSETDYDKYSIWKFEDNTSFATVSESEEVTGDMSTIKLDNKKEEKGIKVIEKEVEELKDLLKQVLNKLNKQESS